MTNALLDQLLDDLVDRCDDAHGDWSDVLGRAQAGVAAISPETQTAPRRSRSRPRLGRHPRRLALAAVALVVAVLLATPAFGVRDLILDLIGRKNVSFNSGTPAPALVRREFADLGFGAPPSLAPQAIASESRTVTTFRVGGKTHTLWVAPTRGGGFCWQVSQGLGGCLRQSDLRRSAHNGPVSAGEVHPELLSISYGFASPKSEVPSQIEGVVLTPKATQLIAEFQNGESAQIPFVFVSPPIDAGFAIWKIPSGHDQPATRLTAITARDAHGKVLARTVIPLPSAHPVRIPPRPSKLVTPKPPSPLGFRLPAPTPPLQHGSSDGVTITVGTNGVVVFNTKGLDAARSGFAKGRLGVGCFTIQHDQLGIWPRELLTVRGFGPTIKVRLFGVPHPYDGCEIEATYGHRWPDKFGSHSLVEIPLSATGRRYFSDRAAARDLALFVRSKRGHQLRREQGEQLQRDLARVWPRLVRLAAAGSASPAGRIGYALTSHGVVFVERSTTGKRFQVTISNGRVVSENVKPYAFVF